MIRLPSRYTRSPYTTLIRSRPIANAVVSCRAHGPRRATHIVKVEAVGTYEIHLNGAGFDDFVIRTRGVAGSAHNPGSRTSGEKDRKSTRLNSSHANISYAVF